MRKWLTVAVAVVLVATGCEQAFEDATVGLDPAPTSPPPVQDGPVVDTPPTDTVRPLPTVTTPILETDGLTLVWATERNAEPEGELARAAIGRPFEVRLEVTDTEIDRVEWYIDGLLFRDDDIKPPFNLRYTGVLPVEGTFESDQGIDHSWTFVPGRTYSVQAVVHRGSRSVTVEAEFAIVAASTDSPSDPASAPTTTAAPVTTTTTAPVPTTTTAAPVSTTTTAAPVTTTTAAAPVAADGRRIVMADASTVLDQPNTIYDFNNGKPGEVVILASNVEARNIRGGGARRIGARNGQSITDSGFRNFEFTFAHVQMSDGATVTRPYFINGTDVNAQPNVGDGDIIQFFAYGGDIIDPLVDNVTVHGKQRPSGSDAHNDGIQYTGMNGGEVVNPTIRNSTILGASSAAVQAKHVVGTFTIENTTLSERFESYHAVIAKPGNSSSSLLWRNNTLLDGASVAATGGWTIAGGSNGTGGDVTIN